MQKKVLLQFFLFSLILVMGIFFYRTYFYDKNEEIPLQNNTTQKMNSENKKSNIIYNIEYIAEDRNGNSYIIKSDYGELKSDNSNLITLKEVLAVINIKNSSPIKIYSDHAIYNNTSYDTEFYGNVRVTYIDHNITSDNLDLYFKKDLAYISNNVVYKNLNTTLQADKIEMDLVTKNSNIYMNNKFRKVKVTNKKNGYN
ncbi:LPS export ABC transporter periplasmic protein LptC [Pelagibacterales bacterium SAG-MED20]|nr:LPS export ABC transporter periplasmic protein LptC [Pelagibacterales bacterium SAG-MED20]